MGMRYSQLTEGERNQIYALLQENVPMHANSGDTGEGCIDGEPGDTAEPWTAGIPAPAGQSEGAGTALYAAVGGR